MLAPAIMPVTAGKKTEKTLIKSSPSLKAGPKLSLWYATGMHTYVYVYVYVYVHEYVYVYHCYTNTARE